jgi:glycosyltransferase involved in cell wall biosynthesis
MNERQPIRAILVDPSLFTAPYDAALNEGLLAAGIDPIWAVRPLRKGDEPSIPERYIDAFFYRHVDQMTWLPAALRKPIKGFAHAWGLAKLAARIRRHKPHVVHFQWTVLPVLDALAMILIRQKCLVVITVHDTTSYNGDRISTWQAAGFDLPMKMADRVIVHTEGARKTLLRRGIPAAKLAVIPHGPLTLPVPPSQTTTRRDSRWTFLLFGAIKPYKGADVFVEAIALLPKEVRERARFIIAGRQRMDLAPICARIADLNLQDVVELQPRRFTDQEMADLFVETDCFVFPYRQIDASGVYFLAKSLSKWLIASGVGVFAEDLKVGVDGVLIPPVNPKALAGALECAINERPTVPARSSSSDWTTIGLATLQTYKSALRASGGE